ncbi:Biogenesis of lysosome-related organelles complex 1 subunit 5 [Aphelenchoides fujianensis]|nr:Biogenesis of lysosome-related organelles complex 1 subunit 5 [Aphelenchoides fujianensis]
MSLEEVDREIPLRPGDVFNHSVVLKPEIQKFRENFVGNERYKEFDSLIRKNHRMYEANDVLPHLHVENLGKLAGSLRKLEESLKRVIEGRFVEKDLKQMDLSGLTQMEIMKIAEAKVRDLTPVPHLDAIAEVAGENSDRE